MNEDAGDTQRRFRFSKIFWIGIGLLAVGIGPLLLVILFASLGFGDPNPNPVAFGILAFLLFWPSIGLIVVGLIVSFLKWRSESGNPKNPRAEPDDARELPIARELNG